VSAPDFDTKERIRQAANLVDIIGSDLNLRRAGRMYTGLCPFHDDTKPSLQINPERQSWRCWVCNIGGDVFSWMMQREGVEFREALEMLAERFGIPLRRSPQPAKPGGVDDKRRLYAVTEWAAAQFHHYLLESREAEAARRYLDDRGFTEETIRRFQIGFSPNEWSWLIERARNAGHNEKLLEAVGLAGRSERTGRVYDRFKGRVIFPIRDTQQRTLAYGGRILPELADERAAKYINSPETRLFSKSREVYGLDLARPSIMKSRQAVVMEGYTDVVMAAQFGIENVVAVLGTALGAGHVQLLRRHADSITLLLDGDEAGQKRTQEVLELFVAADVDLRIATLPAGADPCDLLLDHGDAALREVIDNACDALEYRFRCETAGLDVTRDLHGANRALENILSTIAKAPRDAGGGSDARLRENQVLARLSREFSIGEAELRQRLSTMRRPKSHPPADQQRTAERPPIELDPLERELLELLTQQPELVSSAMERISAEDLTSGAMREIFAAYQSQLEHHDETTFQALLLAIDDPRLKSLLVDVDEAARRKLENVQEEQLLGIVSGFELRRRQRQQREHQSALEKKRFQNEEEELAVLQQILQAERDRQGIS